MHFCTEMFCCINDDPCILNNGFKGSVLVCECLCVNVKSLGSPSFVDIKFD